MSPVQVVRVLDSVLYRLARLPNPLAWPPWEFVGSGRFDDRQRAFRTLYAADQRRTCFIEALARFRPAVSVLARLDAVTGSEEALPRAAVPAEWYRKRGIGRFRVQLAQPLLDLRSLETREVLRAELAAAIERAGLADLDVSGVCGPRRDLTQEIARWAYEHGYEGLLYSSRLDSTLACVAVFEGAVIEPVGVAEPIDPLDPDLRAVAGTFHLAI
jgi:hypothetical protein